jgi:ABC-2 type transport system permease protein
MRNIWTICTKELRSYFVSPIAYLLLTMFALIFGFFFWNALGYFVIEGMEMQMRGQTFPMNINEQIIRPLLSNVSVVGLFFIPMITMRLFAEEKRSGTIELLATSPVRDIEVILGKWLAAMILYACLLLFTALNFAFLFHYGKPDWKPLAVGYLGLVTGGDSAGAGNVYLDPDQESDYRRSRDLWRLPAAVGAGVDQRLRIGNLGAGALVSLGYHSL